MKKVLSFKNYFLNTKRFNKAFNLAVMLVLFRNIGEYMINKVDAKQVMLNALIQDSNDAIYLVNPINAKFLSCNRNAYLRLNYSYKELLNMRVFDINTVVKDINLWNQLSGRIRDEENILIETVLRTKNNMEIPVEANISITKFKGHEYFVVIVRDISERKQKEKKIWDKANSDPLTGLPNRRVFNQKLATLVYKTKEFNKYITLIYIDLDNFKEINDTEGHSVGDSLLVAVANRLKGSIRETDCISRFGGDEFIIVLSDILDKEISFKKVENISQLFCRPYRVKGRVFNISASIGVCTFIPSSLDCSSEIDLADQAMYQAKDIEGVSIVFCS